MITLKLKDYDSEERCVCGAPTYAELSIDCKVGSIKIPLCKKCLKELTEEVDNFKNVIPCGECKQALKKSNDWRFSCGLKAQKFGKLLTQDDIGYWYPVDYTDTCREAERKEEV